MLRCFRRGHNDAIIRHTSKARVRLGDESDATLCISLKLKVPELLICEKMLKEVQNGLLANSALASFTGVG